MVACVAIAVWAGFAGAGGALGPLIVGFLLTDWWIFPEYWWGAAFLVNVIVVMIVLAAVTIWSPRSRDTESTPLDPFGAARSIVGLAALLYAIIEGPTKGWTSGEVTVAFVIAVVTLAGFVVWERRAKHPMLPMDYFSNRGFSIGSGTGASVKNCCGGSCGYRQRLTSSSAPTSAASSANCIQSLAICSQDFGSAPAGPVSSTAAGFMPAAA